MSLICMKVIHNEYKEGEHNYARLHAVTCKQQSALADGTAPAICDVVFNRWAITNIRQQAPRRVNKNPVTRLFATSKKWNLLRITLLQKLLKFCFNITSTRWLIRFYYFSSILSIQKSILHLFFKSQNDAAVLVICQLHTVGLSSKSSSVTMP